MALSRVVSAIFNVQKCRDLEIGVKVIGTDNTQMYTTSRNFRVGTSTVASLHSPLSVWPHLGLLCRWLSITEWEMHITPQGPRLRNDLYCVEWDVKLYCTIPYPPLHILATFGHLSPVLSGIDGPGV